MTIREHYRVLFEDMLLGDYYTSEEGLYRFVPAETVPDSAKPDILFSAWREDSGWTALTTPLAFFQRRIDDGRRFDPDGDAFGYHTDPFRLLRVRET